ncbi:unnamed protein product [Amoebophrya sp. A25]|nr:unnamed protein product [Amoebophrya sp. A25]|eukprot:GSA25T00015175001.1
MSSGSGSTALLSGSYVCTQDDALERSFQQWAESGATSCELHTGVGPSSEKLVANVYAMAKEIPAKVEMLGGGLCRITRKAES